MAIGPDPSKLETTLTLRDGRRARVRSIRPADANMDRAFFAGLSEQSRYMRFMQHLAELTPRLVQQFTQIDDTREMALVGPIVRNEAFFFVTILALAATMLLLEWRRRRSLRASELGTARFY